MSKKFKNYKCVCGHMKNKHLLNSDNQRKECSLCNCEEYQKASYEKHEGGNVE